MSAPHTPRDHLSERQSQVLRLLAAGHTNKEIAHELGISVRTVEMHRADVMGKLNLATRAEIVRYALERGLLDD
jgi:two-component system response regulator NreC